MLKILFVCVHNSARSQMAEAFFNYHSKGDGIAESAGIEPGKLNQNVVKVMAEKGIDISSNSTKGVFDLYKQGRTYSHIIAVCDESTAQRCPIFPGVSKKLVWGFPDPSSFSGNEEEILEQTRQIRNMIESKVEEFLASN